MKIKIKNNAHEIYRRKELRPYKPIDNFNGQWYDTLKSIAGMEIEVETEYLFNNQFNTVPIRGVSKLGLRIMAYCVEYVVNDARIKINKMKCGWCGKVTVIGKICPYCNKNEYLEYFDKENIEPFTVKE